MTTSAISQPLKHGGAMIIASTACAGLSFLGKKGFGGISLLANKVNTFIENSCPPLQGIISSTLVVGGANFVGMPLLNYATTKLEWLENHQDAARFSMVFLTTLFCTPRVCRHISHYQVSYLTAALYGAVGGILTAICHEELETGYNNDVELPSIQDHLLRNAMTTLLTPLCNGGALLATSLRL